jgi:hypothetical protein
MRLDSCRVQKVLGEHGDLQDKGCRAFQHVLTYDAMTSLVWGHWLGTKQHPHGV